METKKFTIKPCPECTTNLSTTSEFCSYCGYKFTNMETVGIQLRRYIKSGGEPLAIYECIFRTKDWEKDRMKFINIMNGIGKLADKELEERFREKKGIQKG